MAPTWHEDQRTRVLVAQREIQVAELLGHFVHFRSSTEKVATPNGSNVVKPMQNSVQVRVVTLVDLIQRLAELFNVTWGRKESCVLEWFNVLLQTPLDVRLNACCENDVTLHSCCKRHQDRTKSSGSRHVTSPIGNGLFLRPARPLICLTIEWVSR